jgi:hypothetical protein
MTYIHYHKLATIVPQYGFEILEINDSIMTIHELRLLLQNKLLLHGVPIDIFNIADRQDFKYKWSYNKYVPRNNSLVKLTDDDLVSNYDYILVNYDHSQHNEDHAFRQIFNTIGTQNKYCVEIGAGDGSFTSNTIIMRNQGWNGLLIDTKDPPPNKEFINAKYMQKFISRGNVECLLHNSNVPLNFDFLSIDIDSHDYHIWDAIKTYRPRVVCIEVDADYRYQEFVRAYEDSSRTHQSSSSIISMSKLATDKKYSLVYNNGGNAFYVVNEEFNKFKLFTKQSRINKFNTIYNNMQQEKLQTYSVRNNVEMDNYMHIINTYIQQESTGYNSLFIETVDLL